MHHYFVIDSSQQSGYYKRVGRHGISFRSLFLGSAEEHLQDIAPLLVEIPGDLQGSYYVRAEIARIASNRPCISVLGSELDIDALAYHLRQFHIVDLPEGKRMILRWYDTRILPAWWMILEKPQKKAFSQGVMSWEYYDRFGDRLDLMLPNHDGPMASCPLYLSSGQYQDLLDAAEPDVVISHLKNILRDELRRIPPKILYSFVCDHLRAARNFGLENFDDQVQYLIVALYTSGGFVNSPVVKRRLEFRDGPHEIPFNEWVGNLPSSVWSTGTPLWEAHGEKECGIVAR